LSLQRACCQFLCQKSFWHESRLKNQLVEFRKMVVVSVLGLGRLGGNVAGDLVSHGPEFNCLVEGQVDY
jgi:hypothetical protein